MLKISLEFLQVSLENQILISEHTSSSVGNRASCSHASKAPSACQAMDGAGRNPQFREVDGSLRATIAWRHESSNQLALEVKKDLHRCLTQCRAWHIEIWQVIVFACLGVAGTQAQQGNSAEVRAWCSSREGKIQAAVAEVMKPFEWGRKEKEVIPRPVIGTIKDQIGTIKDRIKSWNQHATVIHGQLDSGRTWAVYEALRGVRGVVRFKIGKAEWETEMCKQLRVDDTGMFKEVMRGVLKKLKNFPDNLTKYPVLLLDIPCATTEGLT